MYALVYLCASTLYMYIRIGGWMVGEVRGCDVFECVRLCMSGCACVYVCVCKYVCLCVCMCVCHCLPDKRGHIPDLQKHKMAMPMWSVISE